MSECDVFLYLFVFVKIVAMIFVLINKDFATNMSFIERNCEFEIQGEDLNVTPLVEILKKLSSLENLETIFSVFYLFFFFLWFDGSL